MNIYNDPLAMQSAETRVVHRRSSDSLGHGFRMQCGAYVDWGFYDVSLPFTVCPSCFPEPGDDAFTEDDE